MPAHRSNTVVSIQTAKRPMSVADLETWEPPEEPKEQKRVFHLPTLAEAVSVIVVIGLLVGGLIYGKQVIEISHIHSQVAQIEEFDSAIAEFFDEYGGLPGDLLSVRAQREGLPFGDGKPGHGDGDGKISPCNLGWQWSLGCETALFWSQLYSTGLVSGNFGADSQFPNDRLAHAGLMFPYLPQSPMGKEIYITVWNTDPAMESPSPRLPYGNYYEITRISGIHKGRMSDHSDALTPLEAQAIDKKMDDGSPFTGRVVANGEARWPNEAWGTFANADENSCVSEDHVYNAYDAALANQQMCHLAIAFNCCKIEDEE